VGVLDDQYSLGRCGVSGSTVRDWGAALLDQLSLSVADAQAIPPGGLGDIELTMTDGTRQWIEVKAQSKKPRFADLTQADWVRDETDALRKLFIVDGGFRSQLSEPVADGLTTLDGGESLVDWSFEELWLADVALLYSSSRRAMAGVERPSDLVGFLERKHLVHLTMEGIRSIRLDLIAAVQDVLDGRPLFRSVGPLPRADAKVWLSTESTPARSSIDFIYSVGNVQNDGTVLGRHKMNARAIARSSSTIVIS